MNRNSLNPFRIGILVELSLRQRLDDFANRDLTALTPEQAAELRALLRQAGAGAEGPQQATAPGTATAPRDLAWVKDTEGRYLWANRAYCDLCGLELDRLHR